MARPRKEGMDYFPHDVNLSDDKKVEALRILHGNDGYAFYCIMLEQIYQETNFELDVSDAETIQILAKKVEVTPEKLEKMIFTSIKHRLFDRERYEMDKVLTSQGIKKRSSVVIEKRDKMRKTYVKSTKPEVSDIVSDAETEEEMPQSKSKVKVKDKVIDKDKENKKTPPDDSGDVISVFEYWQNLNIKKHREFTQKMRSAINSRLKKYTTEEIMEAMSNYKMILESDAHWFTHRYNMADFLKPETLDGFLTESNPLVTYRKNTRGSSRAEETKRQLDLLNLNFNFGEGGKNDNPTIERTGRKEIVELDKNSFSVF